MGIIDDIYNQGDDALLDQFEVNVAPLSGVIDSTNLKFRIQTFDAPEDSLGNYEIKYKGITVQKFNGDDTTPKTLSFTLRVNKDYSIYKKFKDWIDLIKNPDTGNETADIIQGGIPAWRTDMTFNSIDASGALTGLETTYNGCWPQSISSISYDQGSGEPVNVTITCMYLKKLTN